MKREKSEFDILKKIEEERLKRNWSEYTLAKNSGITQSTISTWYRKSLQPSIASLEKICKGFGISLSEFFKDDQNNTNLTPSQIEMISLWESLSPNQREKIIMLIKAFKTDN